MIKERGRRLADFPSTSLRTLRAALAKPESATPPSKPEPKNLSAAHTPKAPACYAHSSTTQRKQRAQLAKPRKPHKPAAKLSMLAPCVTTTACTTPTAPPNAATTNHKESNHHFEQQHHFPGVRRTCAQRVKKACG
nr:MAG TPA: hypothetical protein [Caudoviricetes sp.]